MAAKHWIHAAGFTGNPTSIVIDVYDADNPGSILATIPNVDIARLGTTSAYVCELRSVSVQLNLPPDGDSSRKSYAFLWRDDAGTQVLSSAVVSGLDGLLEGSIKRTPVYPSTTVPSRGITQAIIDAGKPSHFKVEVAGADLDFASPSTTFYLVYAYDSDGRVQSVTPSATVPSP